MINAFAIICLIPLKIRTSNYFNTKLHPCRTNKHFYNCVNIVETCNFYYFVRFLNVSVAGNRFAIVKYLKKFSFSFYNVIKVFLSAARV